MARKSFSDSYALSRPAPTFIIYHDYLKDVSEGGGEKTKLFLPTDWKHGIISSLIMLTNPVLKNTFSNSYICFQ